MNNPKSKESSVPCEHWQQGLITDSKAYCPYCHVKQLLLLTARTQTPMTNQQKTDSWIAATIELPSQENCYNRGITDSEKHHGIGLGTCIGSSATQTPNYAVRVAFELWAKHPDRGGKLPTDAHANGAYKDSRTYSAYYGFINGWKISQDHADLIPQKKALQEPVEKFCFCDDTISLQMVSGVASPEGYSGKITLKIGEEYRNYYHVVTDGTDLYALIADLRSTSNISGLPSYASTVIERTCSTLATYVALAEGEL